MKLRYIASLAAAAAAASIFTTPVALADAGSTQQSCSADGSGTICQSPGNVQLNDSAPVQFGPQYPYWAGDIVGPGFIGGHGGFHGGHGGYGGGHGR